MAANNKSEDKKQTNTKQTASEKEIVTQTENNNAKKTELVSDETKEQMTKSELAALEIEEAKANNNEIPSKKYKLSRSNTQYTDPVNGWTIIGDQEKELPKNPSPDTLARIKEGFLVEA